MAIKTNKNVKPFGMADKIGYAFGDFGNDFTLMLSSMFMMKFYTDRNGRCTCHCRYINDDRSFC